MQKPTKRRIIPQTAPSNEGIMRENLISTGFNIACDLFEAWLKTQEKPKQTYSKTNYKKKDQYENRN